MVGCYKKYLSGKKLWFLFWFFPEWSDGSYGMDSTTTKYTILSISEMNKEIGEEEEDPNHSYCKQITIMVFEKRENKNIKTIPGHK